MKSEDLLLIEETEGGMGRGGVANHFLSPRWPVQSSIEINVFKNL